MRTINWLVMTGKRDKPYHGPQTCMGTLRRLQPGQEVAFPIEKLLSVRSTVQKLKKMYGWHLSTHTTDTAVIVRNEQQTTNN